MKEMFSHVALNLQESKPLVYTALSKHVFYYRMFISKFVLEQGSVPLNPFMVFDYFLLDSVDRNVVREANNNLVKRSDALWVFGAISNGMLAEIRIATSMNKPIRYFSIEQPQSILEIAKAKIIMEEDVEQFRNEL